MSIAAFPSRASEATEKVPDTICGEEPVGMIVLMSNVGIWPVDQLAALFQFTSSPAPVQVAAGSMIERFVKTAEEAFALFPAVTAKPASAVLFIAMVCGVPISVQLVPLPL